MGKELTFVLSIGFACFYYCIVSVHAGKVTAQQTNVTGCYGTNVTFGWIVETETETGQSINDLDLYIWQKKSKVLLNQIPPKVQDEGKRLFGDRLSATYQNGIYEVTLRNVTFTDSKTFDLEATFRDNAPSFESAVVHVNIEVKPSDVSNATFYYVNSSCVFGSWRVENTGDCNMTYQIEISSVVYTTTKTEITICFKKNEATSVHVWASHNGHIGKKVKFNIITSRKPTAAATTTTTTATTARKSTEVEGGSEDSIILYIGVVVGGVLLIIIIIITFVCFLKYKQITKKTGSRRCDQVIYSQVGPGGGRTGPRPEPDYSDYALMRVDDMGYPIDGANPSAPQRPVSYAVTSRRRSPPPPPESDRSEQDLYINVPHLPVSDAGTNIQKISKRSPPPVPDDDNTEQDDPSWVRPTTTVKNGHDGANDDKDDNTGVIVGAVVGVVAAVVLVVLAIFLFLRWKKNHSSETSNSEQMTQLKAGEPQEEAVH